MPSASSASAIRVASAASPEHHRNDRMLRRARGRSPAPSSRARKRSPFALHAPAQRRAFVALPAASSTSQRRRGDAGRERVREEIRARALAQQLDDFRAPGGVAARRAAQRLAERAGDDVDAALDAAELRRAAPAARRRSRPRASRRPSPARRACRRDRRSTCRSAMMPSIENTPSVAISLKRAPAASASSSLRLEVRHVVVAIAVALAPCRAGCRRRCSRDSARR